MNVVIRRAEARDVPRMLALVQELALFERAPEEVIVTETEMQEAGFGAAPAWFGWVVERQSDDGIRSGSEQEEPTTARLSDPLIARSSDRIVGMAVCYERYSTWKGRRLYLEDIIVTEQARGLRIGDRLFRQCAAYALEHGYSGLQWQVLDWNVDAIRFYDRFGAAYSREWLNGSLDREQLKAIAVSR